MGYQSICCKKDILCCVVCKRHPVLATVCIRCKKNSFMGYQSIWLQKRHHVLLTVCVGCKGQLHGLSKYLVAKKTYCVVSNLCLLQKILLCYINSTINLVAKDGFISTRLPKYLVAKDSFISAATKVSGCKRPFCTANDRHTLSGCERHPVLSVPVLPGWKRCAVLTTYKFNRLQFARCTVFTMYATGWQRCTVLTMYLFNRLQVARDVLCSPCMQQAARDVLCSPCLQYAAEDTCYVWLFVLHCHPVNVSLLSCHIFCTFPLFTALHVLFLLLFLFFIQS